jgi:hypothetical protein
MNIHLNITYDHNTNTYLKLMIGSDAFEVQKEYTSIIVFSEKVNLY